jgi:hypothetical protein
MFIYTAYGIRRTTQPIDDSRRRIRFGLDDPVGRANMNNWGSKL